MISPYNGHDFSRYLTEVFEVPRNIKASEIMSIRRSGEHFYFSWRREGKVFICRNLEAKLALTIIMGLKDEIKKRPDPEDRVEDWECQNEHGVFDFSIYCALLKSRNNG